MTQPFHASTPYVYVSLATLPLPCCVRDVAGEATVDPGVIMTDRSGELRATLEQTTQPPRLAVTGAIDTATVEQFDQAVRQAAARGPRLIIDLTGARFMSSSAITTLSTQLDHIVAVAATPHSSIARALTPRRLPPHHSRPQPSIPAPPR